MKQEYLFCVPEYLSNNDHASSFDVIKRAIDFLTLSRSNKLIVFYFNLHLLFLRLAWEIDVALEFFVQKVQKVSYIDL